MKALLLSCGIVLAMLLLAALSLGYFRPVPDDPFFRLSVDGQQAALGLEYPAEKAVAVYLQAAEFYRPYPGRLSSALASRVEVVLPILRYRLARRPPAPEGYFIVEVLWTMELYGSYAVSADPELMRLAEAAVSGDRQALSLLRRIREHGEASK